jgi:hypothetical protein
MIVIRVSLFYDHEHGLIIRQLSIRSDDFAIADPALVYYDCHSRPMIVALLVPPRAFLVAPLSAPAFSGTDGPGVI